MLQMNFSNTLSWKQVLLWRSVSFYPVDTICFISRFYLKEVYVTFELPIELTIFPSWYFPAAPVTLTCFPSSASASSCSSSSTSHLASPPVSVCVGLLNKPVSSLLLSSLAVGQGFITDVRTTTRHLIETKRCFLNILWWLITLICGEPCVSPLLFYDILWVSWDLLRIGQCLNTATLNLLVV